MAQELVIRAMSKYDPQPGECAFCGNIAQHHINCPTRVAKRYLIQQEKSDSLPELENKDHDPARLRDYLVKAAQKHMRSEGLTYVPLAWLNEQVSLIVAEEAITEVWQALGWLAELPTDLPLMSEEEESDLVSLVVKLAKNALRTWLRAELFAALPLGDGIGFELMSGRGQ